LLEIYFKAIITSNRTRYDLFFFVSIIFTLVSLKDVFGYAILDDDVDFLENSSKEKNVS